MTIIELIKKQIEIIKKLIRYHQLLLGIKKNEPKPFSFYIKTTIRETAIKYNINPEMAEKVAQCESGLNPFAIGFNANETIDRGLFQWNDFFHPEITDEMAFNYKTATELFCQAVKEGHLSWWNSSRSCWSK